MLSLDPHDKFGNKHSQASLSAVSDIWLSVCLSGSMEIKDSALAVQKSMSLMKRGITPCYIEKAVDASTNSIFSRNTLIRLFTRSKLNKIKVYILATGIIIIRSS